MTVKELYSSPDKWTQNICARDADGNATGIHNEKAVRWCLLGALYKCYRPSKVSFLRNRFVNNLQLDISEWNDAPERTFEDVKTLLEQLDI